MTLKTIIDNFIIIGTLTGTLIGIILLVYWYIRTLNNNINYLITKLKCYDIMLIKYENLNPHNPFSLNKDDLQNIKKSDILYFSAYKKELKEIETRMFGNNKTQGFNK